MIKKLPSLFLVIILAMVLSACGQNMPLDNVVFGQLQRVVSGQTLEVMINNQSYRVRLTGLNVPENQQEMAEKTMVDLVTNNGQNSIENVSLALETDLTSKDSFGRISGYVWSNDVLINRIMIERGRAIANLTYTDGKYDDILIDAQSYARIMGKGVWE